MTKWYMGADGVEYPDTEMGGDWLTEEAARLGMVDEQGVLLLEEQEDTREQWQVEEEEAAVALMDRFYSDLFAILSRAHNMRRNWKASGEEGMDPLKAFELSLGRIQNDLKDLMAHKHTWNEAGFCETCGEDGNA